MEQLALFNVAKVLFFLNSAISPCVKWGSFIIKRRLIYYQTQAHLFFNAGSLIFKCRFVLIAVLMIFVGSFHLFRVYLQYKMIVVLVWMDFNKLMI